MKTITLLDKQTQTFQNSNYKPEPSLNIFQRKERMLRVASKFFRGAKANISRAVFDFFLCKADNITGISYHSIETISEFIGFSRQWVQEGLNLLVEKKLIFKTRRGLKKTNVYELNYELIGEHSYKPHNCLKDTHILVNPPPCNEPNSTDAMSVASQSTLSSSNTSTSIKEDKKIPENYYRFSKSSVTRMENKDWKPVPMNRKEELEFLDSFQLNEKANKFLREKVSGGYLIESQYREGFRKYLRNYRPPKKQGEFWNYRNATYAFYPYVKATKKIKEEKEAKGQTFRYTHDYIAYKENKAFLARSKTENQSQVQVQEPQNQSGIQSLAEAMTKIMTNIQQYEGEETVKTSSYNAEVTARIEQEPDKLRQGLLKVCSGILPDVVFLKAEKTLKITRTEDEDEITFDIIMGGIFNYEYKIKTALQEALVSAEGKRVYVRLIS